MDEEGLEKVQQSEVDCGVESGNRRLEGGIGILLRIDERWKVEGGRRRMMIAKRRVK